MTQEEHEWQEVADQVRAEAAKTGRDELEILEAMRDEGYIIKCSDELLERVARMARP